jgi:tRNA G18 (ribose-2'-O)-methylase SpoU
MRITSFNRTKFLALTQAQKHKKASEVLRLIQVDAADLSSLYKQMEKWMQWPELDFSHHESVSNRFHWHLSQAGISWKEHSLLYVRRKDKTSDVPFLPISIYLDRLRSAFNVGSIIRTTEAFRLGTVYCSPSTPGIDNPKVQKASMGTCDHVPCFSDASIHILPKPWIALETASPSKSLHTFVFPAAFTLILGNEEHGISKEILSQADEIIEIPLVGNKNSLNVASAFSIVAAKIRSQHQEVF